MSVCFWPKISLLSGIRRSVIRKKGREKEGKRPQPARASFFLLRKKGEFEKEK